MPPGPCCFIGPTLPRPAPSCRQAVRQSLQGPFSSFRAPAALPRREEHPESDPERPEAAGSGWRGGGVSARASSGALLPARAPLLEWNSSSRGPAATPLPRATPLSGPQPPNGCRGVHRTAAWLRVAAGGFPRATCAPGAELDLLGSCCTHPARETPQSGRTGGRACHEQLRGNGEGPSRGREGPWMPGGGVSSAWRSAPRSTRTADHRWCTAARQPRWRRARCTRTPGPGPSERQTWPARAASSCPG
jgi:hypothetical protein